MREVPVDAVRDLLPAWQVRVKVRRLREARLRIWLAGLLIRLAARVLNCTVTLEED